MSRRKMSREDWEIIAWGIVLGLVVIALYAAAHVNGKL